MENKKSFANSIKIVAVLTLICVFIALLLAVVNNITKDVIAENSVKERDNAILAIFPDGNKVQAAEVDGTEIYIVTKDGNVLGYCVPGIGTGFGGEISTMIGFGVDGSVNGVRILSMSETPGVGSKTKSDDFLSRFTGLKEEAVIGQNVDGITGATISSKGVSQAVNNAKSVNVDLSALSQEFGLTLVSSAD